MGDCCHGTCWLQVAIVIAALIGIYAKFFRARVFAYFLNGFATNLKDFLQPCKKKIFAEAFEKLKKPTTTLKIIEIGVGTGTNFKFYPENSEITISDKTDVFLPYLKESLKSICREDIKIHDFIVNNAEKMNIIEENSMDAVVATFTLCSVDNLSLVFNEIHRVLKPGGVFIFMDHSKDIKDFKMNILQTIIEPIWSFIFDNCRFRDIKSEFQKYSKFDNLEIYEHAKCKGPITFLINPIFYGYAQK
jgi:ubiquinone/menaquinone biosynthesis C-methylase UbiE